MKLAGILHLCPTPSRLLVKLLFQLTTDAESLSPYDRISFDLGNCAVEEAELKRNNALAEEL